MKIRDIGKPVTAKSLNESLAARFGKKLDLERFTLEQLEDSRNKLRTKLKAVETTESFDNVHNESYQKTKMYLDILNAEISERGGYELANESLDLNEASESEAELVIASKTMVDKLTGWMEDVAEMQTETMLDLADSIRDELGSEMSEQFVNTVKPGLEALYSAMEETRRSLTNGVGLLTGESTGEETLGAEEPGMGAGGDLGADELGAGEPEMGAEDDMSDLDAELDSETPDEFSSPRPRRESIEYVEEKAGYSAKKAAAGKDIGKPGKQFAKIAKSAGEKYGSKERGEKVAGAVLKKLRTTEAMDPTRLATILSKKK